MTEYTLDFLNEKADKMFAYLKEPMPSMDHENKVVDRLMMFGKMLAESGEYKSAAAYQVDNIVHGEIAKSIDMALSDKMSASLMNQYVKTAAREWTYLVNAFDRINSAAGKMIMAIQTLISYEKAKMNLL